MFSQTLYAIEKLLAGLNIQLKISINQLLILLHHNTPLLMKSHGHSGRLMLWVSLFCVYTFACMISKPVTQFIDQSALIDNANISYINDIFKHRRDANANRKAFANKISGILVTGRHFSSFWQRLRADNV